MAFVKIVKIVALFLVLWGLPARAHEQETVSPQAWPQWLAQFQAEALAQGISPHILQAALGGIMPDPRVVALDRKQPEGRLSFARYSRNVVSKKRVKDGRKLMARHRGLLREISANYGVPPQMIVALWGIESAFGRSMGRFDVVTSLATLAYEGRRAEFFRSQLMIALRIMQEERRAQLQGSWAGAMGQCQFMPSTYDKYAVDHNGDGRRDIWGDQGDVFASIANYLVAEGWKRHEIWGREVRLRRPLPREAVGLEVRKPLREWSSLGLRRSNGGSLPKADLTASLIQPDGPGGRSFLVYDNFRALMRWNRSTYFAATAGLLADALR